MYDLSDTEPLRAAEIVPDGTFAKVSMTIRPGGVDGPLEADRGLLKASGTVGSDVLQLDCEFTVTEGTFARRKFWHPFTVSGGKVDEKGSSIGWNISKRIFRGMIDSALGLDPEDNGEAARARRVLRGLSNLSGIAFVAKIAVEASEKYGDRNRLDRPVLPNEKEWKLVMEGKEVPASPGHRSRKDDKSGPTSPAAAQPAWQQTAPAAPAPSPAWQQTAPVASAPQPAPAQGPAWLNG